MEFVSLSLKEYALPPNFGEASRSVTLKLLFERYAAAESPAKPPPITITFFCINQNNFKSIDKTILCPDSK